MPIIALIQMRGQASPDRNLRTALNRIEQAVKRGAQIVGEVVNYESVYRLCYIRGPEGILIGLAESVGK